MKTALAFATILFASATAFADDESTADPWSDAGEAAPTSDELRDPAPEPAEPSASIPDPPPPARGPFVNAPMTELVAIAPAPRRYTRAVSVQLATLDNTGISIQAERASKVRPKVSYAIAFGGRHSAQGEYGSQTTGIGFEVKRWRRAAAMKGWYVGARTDLSRTVVEDVMEDRQIGELATWSLGVSIGHRWVLWNRVELTPSIGTAMVIEGGMNGASPTTVRGAGVIGLTAGAIW